MNKKLYLILAAASLGLLSAHTNRDKTMEKNPLLEKFDTPFGTPPFDKIRDEHFKPAFEAALREARAETDRIKQATGAPTFANTVEALERAGERLGTVSTIFFNLESAHTNDRMQQIALEVSPLLTEFSNDISLNDSLFRRVKAVYAQKETLDLTPEQSRLLEERYKSFVRNGADLTDRDKEEYRRITAELADLELRFGQNVLAATNAYALHLTDPADLAGLPAYAVEAGAAEAKARGLEGWVYTLHAPSMLPFMQFAENRGLREKMWRAYNSRAFDGGPHDNQAIVKRIAELRLRKANLLGYPTHAAYVLDDRMAKTPEKVNGFLNELLEKSLPYARAEVDAIRAYAASKGLQGELMPWDFSFYSEKYKQEKYALNDELLKPYFRLENVEKAVFLLAGKLYGLSFRQNRDIPVYHPDVKAYEVHDRDGRFLAVLYLDYFPRESKRGGAWMTSYRETRVRDGREERPFVSVVTNFTKPTANTPSLLTFNEVTTILHEFGHALHGMLAEGTYASLTGTNVTWDFVELPSQIMENWATEKEFLDLWAAHYQTGEKMPQELIDKIVASRNYLSGYQSVRQISFGMNDMAWHTITAPVEVSAGEYERQATARTRLLPAVEGTAFSPSFSHIFAGGYSAGYYSYKWAEVLEADAFSLFREKGIFDAETADSFRRNILSKGDLEPAMDLYVKFRGREPDIRALFDKLGMK